VRAAPTDDASASRMQTGKPPIAPRYLILSTTLHLTLTGTAHRGQQPGSRSVVNGLLSSIVCPKIASSYIAAFAEMCAVRKSLDQPLENRLRMIDKVPQRYQGID
jgi:hypothetical protein